MDVKPVANFVNTGIVFEQIFLRHESDQYAGYYNNYLIEKYNKTGDMSSRAETEQAQGVEDDEQRAAFVQQNGAAEGDKSGDGGCDE